MRTLAISDLHLGSRSGRDLLRRPVVLDRLIAALRGIDRLVLLGDTLELVETPADEALAASQPVLRAIGAALGPDREVVILAGNHDYALVKPWVRQRLAGGVPIGADEAVPIDATPQLAAVAGWLAPASVQVRYPGVWLTEGLWAHHGHYIDRHLLRRPLLHGEAISTADYERAMSVPPAHLTSQFSSRLPAPLGRMIDGGGQLLTRLVSLVRPFAGAIPGTALVAPIATRIIARQFEAAALPALAAVTEHVAPEARQVAFGHVHRGGPQPRDLPARWSAGGRRLWNTGSWVYEPILLTGAGPEHPYWPGGALLIDGAEVSAIRLLDDVDPRALR
ncbi:MAG: metallophosphoesterase [Patulibacter sp.]